LILLIHPPVAKPAEPPAGIARLSGMLNTLGIKHAVLDANLEGLLYLLERSQRPAERDDAWTVRAFRGRRNNLSLLKTAALYQHLDRYKRAVMDLSRVLEISTASCEANVGLANYQHETLSPLRSTDLISAAERPDIDPFYPYFAARLTAIMQECQPRFVGFSLNYLSQAICVFAMIGFLRREFPGKSIVLGGGLVTSWAKGTAWKQPFSGLVDHFVAGLGEYKLLSILGIERPEKKSFTPDYRKMNAEDYLSPGFVLPYSASSGCYWNRCGFCPEKAEGNEYVPVPAETVLSDLRILRERTNPAIVHLLDSAVSPALMETLSENGPGVPWYGFARAGGHLTDLDFCISLRRSGCVMLKLGLESGDQGVLESMQKGIDVAAASASLKTLKKAGIAAYVYLIFGTPAESDAEARKTLGFIAAHSECISFLNLAIFNMPACSAEALGLETRKFYEGDLSLYTDFAHPRGWDRKAVRTFLETEFKRHPAVSAILKREPPVFTSNHAPFFVVSSCK
jgi:hypothetical protein